MAALTTEHESLAATVQRLKEQAVEELREVTERMSNHLVAKLMKLAFDAFWDPEAESGEVALCFMTRFRPRVDEKKMNGAKVAKSRIHGSGLFSTRDISKGEMITFYPAHYAIRSEKRPDGKYAVQASCALCTSDKNLREHITSNKYALEIKSEHGRYTIYGDPEFSSDAMYLAHFINDGAKPGDSTQSKLLYEFVSLKKQNCAFVNLGGFASVVVAMQDIPAGAEFFVHYGISYWEALHIDNTFSCVEE
jgi:SET domain-containing protein